MPKYNVSIGYNDDLGSYTERNEIIQYTIEAENKRKAISEARKIFNDTVWFTVDRRED